MAAVAEFPSGGEWQPEMPIRQQLDSRIDTGTKQDKAPHVKQITHAAAPAQARELRLAVLDAVFEEIDHENDFDERRGEVERLSELRI